MAQLRFPENIDTLSSPWMLFTTQRPQYAARVRSTAAIIQQVLGDSVALYFPTNHTISDSLSYETIEGGMMGSVINMMSQTSDVTKEDVLEIAQAGIGKVGRAGASLGGEAGRALYDRSRGQVTNPREFMLFKAPAIRAFSFSFEFVPSSANESASVTQIVRFFRKSAYPREHGGGLDYVFPDTFTIQYQLVGDSIVRLPELACTSVTVTYNPNTSSFFQVNNAPVQVNLVVEFTELKPISRELVEAGY